MKRCAVWIILLLPVILLSWRAARLKEPAAGLRFNCKMNNDNTATGTFDVTGLAPEILAQLRDVKWERAQWTALFAVYLEPADGATEKDRPPMLGSYKVEKDFLRFEPRFPLKGGTSFRVVFDPSKLPRPIAGELAWARYAVPADVNAKATTVVQQVYPTADKLPENQLRFYIHFSAPMSRGEAYERIQILDAGGKAVDHPFLELDEELWDPQGRRFTLFLHPGRVKRGLKPREELGPILEERKTYTLVIDRRWSDAKGNPLKESFRKTFRVTAPDDNPPDPKSWKLQAPAAGTRAALTVRFPKPLDHGLLQRMLWVVDADGCKVAGGAAVAEGETVWRFTPEKAWQAGTYRLVADTRLEDLAGNSIARPFEVDVFHPVQREVKAETVAIDFRIKDR